MLRPVTFETGGEIFSLQTILRRDRAPSICNVRLLKLCESLSQRVQVVRVPETLCRSNIEAKYMGQSRVIGERFVLSWLRRPKHLVVGRRK